MAQRLCWCHQGQLGLPDTPNWDNMIGTWTLCSWGTILILWFSSNGWHSKWLTRSITEDPNSVNITAHAKCVYGSVFTIPLRCGAISMNKELRKWFVAPSYPLGIKSRMPAIRYEETFYCHWCGLFEICENPSKCKSCKSRQQTTRKGC